MRTCPRCRRTYPEDARFCGVDGAALSVLVQSAGSFLKTTPRLQAKAYSPPNSVWDNVPSKHSLSPGQLVGEYVVECKLGQGGFGVVYKAYQPLIGKSVAIKVLDPILNARKEIVARFVSEARAVNRIKHRNIVDIFSFGALESGSFYFVMELLEGVTLRTYLDEHLRIDVGSALPILTALAQALDAAHAAGVVHRDVKPENIVLVFEPDGSVFPKLIDFGIAKLAESVSGYLTTAGKIMGTPGYMSPEQCRGASVDYRTDIYSFGIIVHEMLTGRRPFEAWDDLDLLHLHTTEPAPPMSRHYSELSPLLDAPVLSMLAKDPFERPQALLSVVDELTRAAFHSAIPETRKQQASSNIHETPSRTVPRVSDDAVPAAHLLIKKKNLG